MKNYALPHDWHFMYFIVLYSAIFTSRVDRIINELAPLFSVVRHSGCHFHCLSSPLYDVISLSFLCFIPVINFSTLPWFSNREFGSCLTNWATSEPERVTKFQTLAHAAFGNVGW